MATRRTFLGTAAVWWSEALIAAHQHTAAPSQQSLYKFQFFQPKELATLRLLAALIVPADERSGGAPAARVEQYIDYVVSHGAEGLKDTWRKGLVTYAGKTEAQAESQLRDAAKGEFSPRSDAQRFFVLIKGAVVESFYTSQEGINKELGYQGMGFVVNFEGCTHASHSTPEWYKPLIDKEPV